MKPLVLLALLSLALPVFSQDIVTAAQFFNTVSEKYGSVNDYSAHVGIAQGKTTMDGTLYYKNPNKLNITFSNPSQQVINSDGKTLTVYLPRYSVSFSQELKNRSDAAIAAMASKQGLTLLKSSYSISYVNGPALEALEDASAEKVTRLKLTWRSGNQAFRQLELDVGGNGFIRRIVGLTAAQQTVQFDFTAIKTNIGVPDSRFEYDSPATSNRINNFLFTPEG
ncbi:MAG: outer-membrane lipoprotein carrier protein LolA [Spirochaetales bacterium]